MAASTITRDTWTNDTGSAALPNGDGTILNNSVLQDHIYARIDAMFAGAGAYATFTFGGVVAAEGFGVHLFSAGGTGANLLRVRNTTAGTGNYAGVQIGNDADAAASLVAMLSSTYTTAGWNVQDGLLVAGTRAGGISVAATHASGEIRFYTGSGNERARITAAGQLFVGDTSDSTLTTTGLCLNNSTGGGTNIIVLKDSSLVAHGGLGGGETDTFGTFGLQSTLGGLSITGYMEAGSSPALELIGHGASGSGDTTKSTTGLGYVTIRAQENNGSPGADENLVVVRQSGTTRFILDADGDSHQDVGTAWTNFDDHDDLALLHALSAGVSRKGDPLRRTFGRFLVAHKKTLERNRIVTFNSDGHHFINWSRAQMLAIGAIRQVGMRQLDIIKRLDALEAA